MIGYVSKDGKIGYRYIPKIACTTIKYALFELEEKKKYSAQDASENIHKYVVKEKTSSMDHCERRFLVIRDPIKRFLSAYGNRVTFHKELSEEKVLKSSKENYHRIPFFNPSLNQFVNNFEVYLNVRSIFHHAKPISSFLGEKDLTYFSDIFKIEELPLFKEELCGLFGRDVSFGHRQTGGDKFFLKDLSVRQVKKLLKYYREDYELLHKYYSESAVWDEWVKGNPFKYKIYIFMKSIFRKLGITCNKV
jgi:Sulfotransferase family